VQQQSLHPFDGAEAR